VKPIKKILVFRLSSIGDIVLTTALLRCLRNTYPNAQIDFVVKRQFTSLMQCIPFISNVYQLDSTKGLRGLLRLRRNLRKEKYDIALDIHKNWRSYFITHTIGAKQTSTFKKHTLKRSLLIKFKLDAYNIVRPVYLRFIDTAKKIGVVDDGKKTELIIPETVQQIVDNFLEDNGIKPHKNIIVVCPGASFSNKQWQEEKFLEISQRILSELHTQVVLIGGFKEKAICDSIVKQCKGPILNVAGAFDLSQSAALLNRAQLTIANDTGMLHMSESLNVPVVGIYGPTVRQFGYFPILEQSRVAQIELECRPCTKMGMNSCPKNTYECMQGISVDLVFRHIQKILTNK